MFCFSSTVKLSCLTYKNVFVLKYTSFVLILHEILHFTFKYPLLQAVFSLHSDSFVFVLFGGQQHWGHFNTRCTSEDLDIEQRLATEEPHLWCLLFGMMENLFLFAASAGQLASTSPDSHSAPTDRRLGGWMEEEEGDEEKLNGSASNSGAVSEEP